MLGSIAIAVNSLAGPAILQLPYQYQESGLIPTTACLVVVGILSSLCSLHMANVVSQVPGNSHFRKMVEFSDPFKEFWNQSAYYTTQVLFFFCATCTNVAAIVDTSEMVDAFLGFHVKSVGFNFDKLRFQTWSHPPCTRSEVKFGLCEPFGDELIYGENLLTLGYVITSLVFLPVCLMDLKENTIWQIYGFSILISISAFFCFSFIGDELSFEHVSWWGHRWGEMFGVILFNFALVLAIPAWLHDKKPNVSVNKVVYGSTAIATGLYVLVGAMGALAIPNVNVNMLNPMISGAYGKPVQLAASLFAFFIIGLDIPLFSVLTRYNLTHSGLCTERTANLIVVWIPWLLSWLLYQGDSIGQLLDWSGVLLTSAVAFILPLYLALRILVTTDQQGSVDIYGVKISKERQIFWLYVTLFVAVCAVVAAIGGQVLAVSVTPSYVDPAEYQNSSLFTKVLEHSGNHHHHHRHHHHHHHSTEVANASSANNTSIYSDNATTTGGR
ncbi:hypothetical protein ACA910_019979 [Epithemia clementina (nom. ined.)]